MSDLGEIFLTNQSNGQRFDALSLAAAMVRSIELLIETESHREEVLPLRERFETIVRGVETSLNAESTAHKVAALIELSTQVGEVLKRAQQTEEE